MPEKRTLKRARRKARRGSTASRYFIGNCTYGPLGVLPGGT